MFRGLKHEDPVTEILCLRVGHRVVMSCSNESQARASQRRQRQVGLEMYRCHLHSHLLEGLHGPTQHFRDGLGTYNEIIHGN